MKKIYFAFFIFILLIIGCKDKNTLPKSNLKSAAPEPMAPPLVLDDRPARPDRKGTGEIAFFYLETCPSCEDYELAENLTLKMENAAKKGHFPWKTVTVTSNNVLTQKQVDDLKEYIDSRGLPDVSLSLPLLFVNNEIVIGYEEIEKLIDGLIEF